MTQKRKLDDLVNKNSADTKVKSDSKSCSKCQLVKVLSLFYTKHGVPNSCCKECTLAQQLAIRASGSSFVGHMVAECKRRTKRHNAQGRDHESSEVTVDLINSLREINNDRCAISGMPMNFVQYSNCQASIDRIDDSKGYTAANSRIVCLEVNTSAKWSTELFLEDAILCGRSPPNFTIEIEEAIAKAQFAASGQRMPYRKWERETINGVEYVTCCFCEEQKSREDFPEYLHNGCNECDIQNRQTLHGASRLLQMNARQSTNQRNNGVNKLNKQECTITILNILEIAKAQNGQCAYSGAPMDTKFGSTRKMSLERKDVNVGYTKENCILVLQRYNASDVTVRAKGPIAGSGGWSKEKSEEFTTAAAAKTLLKIKHGLN